jgi:hypothetical protein
MCIVCDDCNPWRLCTAQHPEACQYCDAGGVCGAPATRSLIDGEPHVPTNFCETHAVLTSMSISEAAGTQCNLHKNDGVTLE